MMMVVMAMVMDGGGCGDHGYSNDYDDDNGGGKRLLAYTLVIH